MKPIAELEQTAIRRVSAPHPERDWVRCAANAPYFQTESGAAWAPFRLEWLLIQSVVS